MRILPALLLAFSSLPPSIASSQGADSLRTGFLNAVHATADSLLGNERSYTDTLFSHGDAYTRLSDSTLRAKIDSLIAAAGDSIDQSGRMSGRTLALDMERSLALEGVPARTTVSLLLRTFEKELHALLESSVACEQCALPEDFLSAEAAFRLLADSLSGYFGDSMATAVEEWESELDESVHAFTDSIDARIRDLEDEQARDIADHASHIDAEAAYETHSSNRGRDNGVNESSFGPTLSYHHRSGLYAEGSIGWVSHPGSGPDDEVLSGGYEFTLSPALSGSLSYTHYWYSDSSSKPQAVTNQSVAGMLLLDADIISMTLDVSDDFGGGGGSEITTSLNLSRDLILSDRALGGTLKIAPTAIATWGDQNEKLRQRRIIRARKKKVVRITGKPLDVFGIMSYEISLPAELQVGSFSIDPTIGYIMPVNVLNGKTVLVKDPSTPDPFMSAGLTVSMTLK